MKIKSLKDLQSLPVEVRVLDKNYNNEKRTEMIGGIFKVNSINFVDNAYRVFIENNTNWYLFNKTDIQIITPLSYNNTRIGIGDWVKSYASWYEVYDCHWYEKEFYLSVTKVIDGKPDYSICEYLNGRQIEGHKPLHKKETITIEGDKYDKNEVENALKDLKKIE